jgi:hypothetical protein
MSLKKTKDEIRITAEGIPLVNNYYDERWSDTIDKEPLYIHAESVTAGRINYEIEFKVMDKVSDDDDEFYSVQSDTLTVIKMFCSQLYTEGLLPDYESIQYEFIQSNQLIGWTTGKVKIYDAGNACTT